ncbi:cleavage and polyadenylation specific factor 5 [Neoconidiobolus thromboides FSU 785]|nr:cleavage and polyadenylation specific factor 5 [Neoconidiobolus thromboides FSU 785]
MESIKLQPLQAFTFDVKPTQSLEDTATAARFQRLQKEVEETGMRRSVEAVLLLHDHRHPHVLMFQIGSTFFKLPGDNLVPGEDPVEGLKKRLSKQLSGDEDGLSKSNSNQQTIIHPDEWEVLDCVGKYYRPNYENNIYPYCPSHVSRPKELKLVYLVKLPKKKNLTVPENLKLIAVPFFELYDNGQRYGQQLSALPHILSRFDFECEE